MGFLAYFGLMAAVVLLYICGIYLIERYTEKRKLNIQKIVLDVSCGYSAIVAAFFIDDALYFRGDFVDLVYIGFLFLFAAGLIGSEWTYPDTKVKK